jgi:hypothetical protein
MSSKKNQKTMRSMRTISKIVPLPLKAPQTSTFWLPEPELSYAGGKTHSDPKVGIALYGPRSLNTSRHKKEVHIGFIGMGEGVEKAQEFFQTCAEGVDGDVEDKEGKIEHKHTPFPGCDAEAGFRCDLRMSPDLIETITQQEKREINRIKIERQKFEALLSLFQDKMTLLKDKDHPLDYITVVLPKDLYDACRVVEYLEPKVGLIHRDLRRAFKAMAMKSQKPTQILQETTAAGISRKDKKLDHKSKIAWNLFTGLYFKIDGLPWGPVGLPPSSCFIGISFFRPLGSVSTLRTSVAQAFDENGEGLILRGHDFEWDEDKYGKSPHLPAEMSKSLIEMVLKRYDQERKQPPQRVVVYKSSRYEPDELEGFQDALEGIGKYDLVALSPTSNVRLVRAGEYPPLRGTSFTIGDVSYLYTSGYLPEPGEYPHGHVPSPLQIADHVGDTSRKELMREIMILTKMNWNSADYAGLLPIPLRFSRLVGDILKEVDGEPETKYKYYM